MEITWILFFGIMVIVCLIAVPNFISSYQAEILSPPRWATKDAGCYYVPTTRQSGCEMGYVLTPSKNELQSSKCCPQNKYRLQYIGEPETAQDVLNYYGWGLVAHPPGYSAMAW